MQQLFTYNTERTCKNADDPAIPLVRNIETPKGGETRIDCAITTLFFLTDGSAVFYPEQTSDGFPVAPQSIVLFNHGSSWRITAPDGAVRGMIFEITNFFHLCQDCPLENLTKGAVRSIHLDFYPLPMGEVIDLFVKSLRPWAENNIKCRGYLESKTKELLFIMQMFYAKEDLVKFFSSYSNPDSRFANLVWQNYRDVRNVIELANMSNQSLSSFKEKFKQVFGMPALKWLNEQRARNLAYDLSCSSKTLDQIADEYHFTSVSYLSTFCSKHLNKTPSEIRAKKPCPLSQDLSSCQYKTSDIVQKRNKNI